MKTKIGRLTSTRVAILQPASSGEGEISKALERYIQQDLFEMALMIDCLLLREKRKKFRNHIWLLRLERHRIVLRSHVPQNKIQRWTEKLGFKTIFDANRHAKNLLFPWFR